MTHPSYPTRCDINDLHTLQNEENTRIECDEDYGSRQDMWGLSSGNYITSLSSWEEKEQGDNVRDRSGCRPVCSNSREEYIVSPESPHAPTNPVSASYDIPVPNRIFNTYICDMGTWKVLTIGNEEEGGFTWAPSWASGEFDRWGTAIASRAEWQQSGSELRGVTAQAHHDSSYVTCPVLSYQEFMIHNACSAGRQEGWCDTDWARGLRDDSQGNCIDASNINSQSVRSITTQDQRDEMTNFIAINEHIGEPGGTGRWQRGDFACLCGSDYRMYNDNGEYVTHTATDSELTSVTLSDHEMSGRTRVGYNVDARRPEDDLRNPLGCVYASGCNQMILNSVLPTGAEWITPKCINVASGDLETLDPFDVFIAELITNIGINFSIDSRFLNFKNIILKYENLTEPNKNLNLVYYCFLCEIK